MLTESIKNLIESLMETNTMGICWTHVPTPKGLFQKAFQKFNTLLVCFKDSLYNQLAEMGKICSRAVLCADITLM